MKYNEESNITTQKKKKKKEPSFGLTESKIKPKEKFDIIVPPLQIN